MEIYLIRHTKPLIEPGICYGQSDIDLSSSFENELQNILQKTPASFDIVFSSPLKRCKQLAERLNSQKIIYDDSLMELNFGEWEMIKWDDINKADLNNWMNNYVDVPPPGGENYKQLYERVNQFWLQSIINLEKEKIAIVTHAGVIRSVLAIILELELKKTFTFSIDYSQVTRIDIDNKFLIIKYINL